MVKANSLSRVTLFYRIIVFFMSEKNQFGEKIVNEKKNKSKQSKFARYSRIPQKRNHQEAPRQQKPQRTQRHKQHIASTAGR